MILKFASPASVSSIFDMEEIQTEVGRVSVIDCLYICVTFDLAPVCVYYTRFMQCG